MRRATRAKKAKKGRANRVALQSSFSNWMKQKANNWFIKSSRCPNPWSPKKVCLWKCLPMANTRQLVCKKKIILYFLISTNFSYSVEARGGKGFVISLEDGRVMMPLEVPTIRIGFLCWYFFFFLRNLFLLEGRLSQQQLYIPCCLHQGEVRSRAS